MARPANVMTTTLAEEPPAAPKRSPGDPPAIPQRSRGAIHEARKRAGIRTDLRTILTELGELRRDVETLTAAVKAPELEVHRAGRECRQ